MISRRCFINATRGQVWDVLVDFSAYHEWYARNPFVRSQNAASATHTPLPDSSESFTTDHYLSITRVHTSHPPSWDDSSVTPFWRIASTLERIISANKSNYTAAWETAMWYLPDEMLYSERWSLTTEEREKEDEGEGGEGKEEGSTGRQTKYLS
ncbi:hypothetical protein NMY22_g13934 [Coprinellus aureogranulatus]|nr:hypothetical protein NMY22_g13934 [Coprinellus aureogranulatus]